MSSSARTDGKQLRPSRGFEKHGDDLIRVLTTQLGSEGKRLSRLVELPVTDTLNSHGHGSRAGAQNTSQRSRVSGLSKQISSTRCQYHD
jgi:hypothetical protein